MEVRGMELTIISARDLKKATMLSKTKTYAVAWISNDHKNRLRTPVDKNNGNDPNWNHAMKFALDEAALQQGRLLLEIAVYADATFRDKEIGRISISLNEFLNPGTTSAQFVSYQIRKPSGKPKGLLNLSVKLAEKAEVKQQQHPQAVAGSYGAAKGEPVIAYPAGSFVAAKAEPVTAYPFYPPAGSSSHPPPNNYYPAPPAGYPPPPPYYQGYSPPPYQGYPANQGYPPYPSYPPVVPAAQQPARKNNKLGMGLGAGLIGGALGGLLLGDIISDASYDGGFDDGYNGDGGDFGGDF